MLGILSLIVLFASQLTDYFKENIQISVILKDNVKEADIVEIKNIKRHIAFDKRKVEIES